MSRDWRSTILFCVSTAAVVALAAVGAGWFAALFCFPAGFFFHRLAYDLL